MKLNLREIIEVPGGSVPFELELDTERLFTDSIVAYPHAPRAEGRIFNEAGVLTLEGELTAEMVCVCDRCGEQFPSVKEMSLSATVVEEDDDNQDDPELFFLDGDSVEIDEIVTTLYILDMETKFLCREECKGLCPQCGKNLNAGPCSCRKQMDPRFAVLEQLLDK